jgi:hypothetical protein
MSLKKAAMVLRTLLGSSIDAVATGIVTRMVCRR